MWSLRICFWKTSISFWILFSELGSRICVTGLKSNFHFLFQIQASLLIATVNELELLATGYFLEHENIYSKVSWKYCLLDCLNHILRRYLYVWVLIFLLKTEYVEIFLNFIIPSNLSRKKFNFGYSSKEPIPWSKTTDSFSGHFLTVSSDFGGSGTFRKLTSDFFSLIFSDFSRLFWDSIDENWGLMNPFDVGSTPFDVGNASFDIADVFWPWSWNFQVNFDCLGECNIYRMKINFYYLSVSNWLELEFRGSSLKNYHVIHIINI